MLVNMKFHVTVGLVLTFIVIVADLRSAYSSPTSTSSYQDDHVECSTFSFDDIEHSNFTLFEDLVNTNPEQIVNNTINGIKNVLESEIMENVNKSVSFYLYTQSNPVNGQELHIDDKLCLDNSNFDANKPTRIITHGWTNSYLSESCTLIRDAYLKNGDYNVMVVDWSPIAKLEYFYASYHVKSIGEKVATMINFLEEQGMNLSKTTVIGHSLGAHVAGLACYQALGIVDSVVGLDPAGPGFVTATSGSRISKGDADYVQIIHTNAGELGFLLPIGDADFYPNGSSRQCGCPLIDINACSHDRSYEYFAESINSSVGFYGRKWLDYIECVAGWCEGNSVSVMGGSKLNSTITGVYFLNTNRESPYALGPEVA